MILFVSSMLFQPSLTFLLTCSAFVSCLLWLLLPAEQSKQEVLAGVSREGWETGQGVYTTCGIADLSDFTLYLGSPLLIYSSSLTVFWDFLLHCVPSGRALCDSLRALHYPLLIPLNPDCLFTMSFQSSSITPLCQMHHLFLAKALLHWCKKFHLV